ncbi:hypothetical protein PMAYCL1PPCAC_01297, partial [Pristionchus mayeri]
ARHCPHCHSAVMFSGNRADSCPCGSTLCGRCPSQFHFPISCNDAHLYQQYLAKRGIEPFFEITPSIARITDLVRCPGCETPMQMERGCAHMTCLCGVQFCYNCGQERDGPHNASACRRHHMETIVLTDVIVRADFLSFPMKRLNTAARHHFEINARRREIKEMLRQFSAATKRRVLRAIAAMTLLHESAILRSRNNERNRLRAGRIELMLALFMNTK